MTAALENLTQAIMTTSADAAGFNSRVPAQSRDLSNPFKFMCYDKQQLLIGSEHAPKIWACSR
jgi:hypothetical protein